MLEPAKTVLSRFGGAGPLAHRLGLDRSTVHRWGLPKERDGRGGLIPAKYHQRLLALAAAAGVDLTAADLVGVPGPPGQPAAAKADDG